MKQDCIPCDKSYFIPQPSLRSHTLTFRSKNLQPSLRSHTLTFRSKNSHLSIVTCHLSIGNCQLSTTPCHGDRSMASPSIISFSSKFPSYSCSCLYLAHFFPPQANITKSSYNFSIEIIAAFAVVVVTAIVLQCHSPKAPFNSSLTFRQCEYIRSLTPPAPDGRRYYGHPRPHCQSSPS